MDNETDVTRGQMDETRASLSAKLETLQDRVIDTVQDATNAVAETVDNVKDAVHETVANVKESFDVRLQVQRHPWAMVGGSIALGFLGGYLLLRFGSSRPAAIGLRQPAPLDGPGITEQPNGDVKASRPVEDTHRMQPVPEGAPAASEPGWLSGVHTRFGPEIAKVKGLAIGVALSAVRDMITQSVPAPMKAGLADVLDGITVKLGGDPVRGQVLKDGRCATQRQNEPYSSAVARPNAAAQRNCQTTGATVS